MLLGNWSSGWMQERKVRSSQQHREQNVSAIHRIHNCCKGVAVPLHAPTWGGPELCVNPNAPAHGTTLGYTELGPAWGWSVCALRVQVVLPPSALGLGCSERGLWGHRPIPLCISQQIGATPRNWLQRHFNPVTPGISRPSSPGCTGDSKAKTMALGLLLAKLAAGAS